MGSKKREPKVLKGRKDYKCLTCNKLITKGTEHLCHTHLSKYLKEAFLKLTRYYVWAKVFESFISLRFCSNRCYRLWTLMHEDNYKDNLEVGKRFMEIVISTRDRRLQGWKDWKVWKEVFEPLNNRFRVYEEEEE